MAYKDEEKKKQYQAEYYKNNKEKIAERKRVQFQEQKHIKKELTPEQKESRKAINARHYEKRKQTTDIKAINRQNYEKSGKASDKKRLLQKNENLNYDEMLRRYNKVNQEHIASNKYPAYSSFEVRYIIGYSVRSFRNLIENGDIETYKQGRNLYVSEKELLRFIQRQKLKMD